MEQKEAKSLSFFLIEELPPKALVMRRRGSVSRIASAIPPKGVVLF
jgi:hypothetical protein